MESRTIIDTAVGIIIAQNRCSQEDAINLIKSASSTRNLKLRDVAAAIVESAGGGPRDNPLPRDVPCTGESSTSARPAGATTTGRTCCTRRGSRPGPAAALRGTLQHGGAERQLLPLAAGHLVRRLAAPAARRFRPVRQGPARPDPRARSCTARRSGSSGSPGAGTSSATSAPCCWSSCRPGMARDDARLDYFLGALPDWIRVAVEFRHPSWDHAGRVRPAGTARRGVLRHERRQSALHPAGHRPVRLRQAARARPPAPVRRLLLGRRTALVGGPDPGVARLRARTSSPISTTTAAATPCGTPPPCGGCWETAAGSGACRSAGPATHVGARPVAE